MVSFQYTLCSNERGGFNTVRCSINNPIMCRYVTMTVTSLTSNCNIKILRSDDFLTFEIGDEVVRILFDDHTQLTAAPFAEMINEKLREIFTEEDEGKIEAVLDNCMRIKFVSTEPFSIVSCSYNVKLLLGLYDMDDSEYPLMSVKNGDMNEIVIEACGYFLSTPILYLVSNLGSPNFRNDSRNGMQSCDVTMRLNNSFTPQIPIIASNGEFSSTVPAGCISGMYFTLVDANMVPLEILNPIYITLTLDNADDSMEMFNRQEHYEEKERQKQLLFMIQQQQQAEEQERIEKEQRKVDETVMRKENEMTAKIEHFEKDVD